MSKIANRTLIIPEKVSVEQQERNLRVSGPNGVLNLNVPSPVLVIIDKREIKTYFEKDVEVKNEALLGTVNSLVSNMLTGVTTGYQKTLDVKGVGYKVTLSDRNLDFSLGYSHNILLTVPSTLKVECLNSVRLIISGPDKQEVGWFAAKIRKFREPNVFVKSYKGIFYQNETIKIKSGKKETKK